MRGCGVRTLAGDVFFDNLKYPDTQLGGLVLTPGVTKALFYFMMDMIIIFPSENFLGNDNGELLQRHSQPFSQANTTLRLTVSLFHIFKFISY